MWAIRWRMPNTATRCKLWNGSKPREPAWTWAMWERSSVACGGCSPRQKMPPKAMENGWVPLRKHRARTRDGKVRRGGYPLGSGGLESSNTCVCHVRLQHSGACGTRPGAIRCWCCAVQSITAHSIKYLRYKQEKVGV
jgi:hypothetical protein